MATIALKLDFKIASWHWTIPELQNIAYFGICFLPGIILAGIKGLLIKFRMKKIIKLQDAKIVFLNEEVTTLKTGLESLQHDSNIKKEMDLPFWEIRLGINTGSVTAGVVGKKKFAYDIWGAWLSFIFSHTA